MSKVTPGTLDVKPGPTRCWKELWLQLMCCAPFRLLFQDFRMEVGGRIRDVLSKMKVEGGTNLVFELKYLHDKSEVFILM